MVTPRPQAGTEAVAEPVGAGRFQVFFDGACPLCRREIAFYRRRAGADAIAWIDLRDQARSREVAPGLSCERALQRFHVRDDEGRLHQGGAAFARLWAELPAFAFWGRLFQAPVLSTLIEAAYALFLPLRPWLQRGLRWRDDA